jgi:hypothetical protein
MSPEIARYREIMNGTSEDHKRKSDAEVLRYTKVDGHGLTTIKGIFMMKKRAVCRLTNPKSYPR